tara:strand:+ start:65 stop:1054 length:990 start_codon:yes stop_codon:yes gene_type:complete
VIKVKPRQIKQILATIVIVIVAAFVLYALLPYVSAFAGALILFALLYPVNKFFRKKIGKKFSALLCILLSILIIVFPLFLISNMLINEVSVVAKDTEFIEGAIKQVNDEINVQEYFSEISTYIKQGIKTTANAFFGSIIHFAVASIILYFALFFMLLQSDHFIKIIEKHLPFNEKNSKILMNEFVNVTKSTVIGMGLIAIIQGLLLGFGFWILGIQGAVFWGFVGAVLSFLPIVGVSVIWIPTVLYQLFIGNYFAGIGLLLWALVVITGSDYLLRPYISKKIAKLHPLITLIGVFIGIPFFGIFGILLGPLLLSYLFLLIKMYGEEYLG